MNRDDIQKLLGGYATGTLTPEEQQALFEAALDDQELFDTLAREQALRDLLRDPAAKAQVLAALDQRPPRWYEGLVRGWRPLAGALAMAGVSAVAVMMWQGSRPAKPVLVAQVSPSPRTEARPAEPAPAPPAAANPALPPPATGDTNAPVTKDNEAPLSRLAKASPPKAAAGRAETDEDRRVKEKQLDQAPPRKDLADSIALPDSRGEAAPLPARPPTPPAVASGFREGAVPAGSAGVAGARPAAEPKAEGLFRSTTGNATGGTVGGVLGGIVGAKPGAPPPPPPVTPKADAQPLQSAQTQGAPSQAAPAQFGQQGQQGARSQVEQGRLALPTGSAAQTVEITATAASLDAASSQDAKSLFYGNPADSLTVQDALGGMARKKVADQPEKTAGRQALANAVAANTRAQAHLNLGVRYSLLRKTAAGGFEQVEPDAVKTGDTLKLELTPNYAGTLLVKARSGDGVWRGVLTHSVEALKPYTTAELKSGENEVQVTLTRVPLAVTGVSLRDDQSGTNAYQQSTTDRATYVVTAPASPLLRFTINLNYK